jgi:type I restriction enzyme S subunit
MGLNRYRLGDLIEQSDLRNTDGKLNEDAVIGLSTQKQLISTKADLSGVGLSSYKLFPTSHFAYVPDTSRRGDKMSLGYNTADNAYIVSSISIVFSVIRPNILNSDYLFMYFNRPEFDRYARFNSWGSAREAFSWDDMCDIIIDLPDLPTQQKYVDVYNAMLANQRAYESGLEDLKLTCDAYIERLRREMPHEAIGEYLIPHEERNTIGLDVNAVRGLAVSKEIIETKANMEGVSLVNYKIMPAKAIAYVPDTSRRGDKVSLGFNDTDNTYLVSSISTVFSTDTNKLLPAYLMLFFSRSEFDRYARFHSWGSAREAFDWEEMCDIQLPIPDIKVQQAIVDIYTSYTNRRAINEKIKMQIKNLCPILIKGSLEEASKM